MCRLKALESPCRGDVKKLLRNTFVFVNRRQDPGTPRNLLVL